MHYGPGLSRAARSTLDSSTIPSTPTSDTVLSTTQTAIHEGFPPPSVLSTPIQPSFFHAHSFVPPRPLHHGHRAAQASIALATVCFPSTIRGFTVPTVP